MDALMKTDWKTACGPVVHDAHIISHENMLIFFRGTDYIKIKLNKLKND